MTNCHDITITCDIEKGTLVRTSNHNTTCAYYMHLAFVLNKNPGLSYMNLALNFDSLYNNYSKSEHKEELICKLAKFNWIELPKVVSRV